MDEVHRQQIKKMLQFYDILISVLNRSVIVLFVYNSIDIILHYLDDMLIKLIATPGEPDI